MERTSAIIGGCMLLHAACGMEESPISTAKPLTVTIDLSSVPPDTIWATRPVEIGSEAAGSYAFERIATAFMRPGGGVMVADAGASLVLEFDDTGKLTRAFGGRGDGPVEFRNLTWIGPGAGDSIVAFDGASKRLTIVDREGTFGRSSFLRMGGVRGGTTRWLAIADAGGATDPTSAPDLLVGFAAFVREFEMEPNGAAERDTVVVLRLDATGGIRDTLALVPNGWWQRLPAEDAYSMSAVRDGPFALMGSQGDRLYLSQGDEPRVHVVDIESGKKMATWDLAGPRGRPYSGPHGLSGRVYIHGLAVSRDGLVWLAAFGRDGGGDGNLWQLIDDGGRRKGVAVLPDDIRILDVDATSLLGLTHDAFGTDHLLLFHLTR